MSNDVNGLWVVPFVINGEMEGKVFQSFDSLSKKWLSICGAHLQHHGPVFDVPWAGKLSHIRTKFTSENGVAIATFCVGDHIAASSLFISGVSSAGDAEVIAMFIESMKRVRSVQMVAASSSPFSALLQVIERPLLATVPWPDDTISAGDHELVRELELHLAGAFFCSSLPSGL